MGRSVARRTIENALRRLGLTAVAGVDEVGRGCLAGPVVAAAVVLDPRRHIPGLADSKVVPVQERETLYATIVTAAKAWAVASVEPVEIDRLNIHRASLWAMRQAVLDLVPLPGSRHRRRASAFPTFRSRNAASSKATAAAPRSPRRPSSPK